MEHPTDTRFSIQEVFFNICGSVEGNFWDVSRVSLNFNKEYAANCRIREVFSEIMEDFLYILGSNLFRFR